MGGCWAEGISALTGDPGREHPGRRRQHHPLQLQHQQGGQYHQVPRTEDMTKQISLTDKAIKHKITASRPRDDVIVNHLYMLKTTLMRTQASLDDNMSRIYRARGIAVWGGDRTVQTKTLQRLCFHHPVPVLVEEREPFLRCVRGLRGWHRYTLPTDLTLDLVKEVISELKTKNEIVTALLRCFGNKNLLIKEFKCELDVVWSPNLQPASAAEYVSSVHTKIQRMIRLAKENDILDQLSSEGIEEPIIHRVLNHPTLIPFATFWENMVRRAPTLGTWMAGASLTYSWRRSMRPRRHCCMSVKFQREAVQWPTRKDGSH